MRGDYPMVSWHDESARFKMMNPQAAFFAVEEAKFSHADG